MTSLSLSPPHTHTPSEKRQTDPDFPNSGVSFCAQLHCTHRVHLALTASPREKVGGDKLTQTARRVNKLPDL